MDNWTITFIIIGIFIGEGISAILKSWAEKIHNEAFVNEITKLTKTRLLHSGFKLTVEKDEEAK
jgi:hypothetical protein